MKWWQPDTTGWWVMAQLALWLALALWIVPQYAHFTYDQAVFFRTTMQLVHEHRFTAYGSFISGSMPHAYTPGGNFFYMMSLPYWLTGSRDPRLGNMLVLLWSGLGIIGLDATLRHLATSRRLRLVVAMSLTWGFWHVHSTALFWSPHLFWGTCLLLVSVDLIMMHQATISWWLSILFGLLASLALQCHVLAVMLLAVCGIAMVWQRGWQRRDGAAMAIVVLVILMNYIPYVYVEATHGFINTRRLMHAIPQTPAGWAPILRSLSDILVYNSPFWQPDWLWQWTPWLRFGARLPILCWGLLGVYGALCSQHSLRRMVLGACVAAPLSFALHHRVYNYYYVSALIPLFLIGPALGMMAMPRRWQWPLMGLMLYNLALGTWMWVDDFTHNQFNLPRTVSRRIGDAEAFLQSHQVVWLPPHRWLPQPMLEELFTQWVVARDILRSDLPIQLRGYPQSVCTITEEPPVNHADFVQLFHTFYLVCRLMQ